MFLVLREELTLFFFGRKNSFSYIRPITKEIDAFQPSHCPKNVKGKPNSSSKLHKSSVLHIDIFLTKSYKDEFFRFKGVNWIELAYNVCFIHFA